MSKFVQGTIVFVTGTFRDPDTGKLSDPPDVALRVEAPGAGSPTTTTYTGGGVTKMSTGVYRGTIDTTSAPGTWLWQIGSTGPAAVKSRGSFVVDPAL